MTEKEQALAELTINLYKENDLEYAERTVAYDANWRDLICRVTIRSEIHFWQVNAENIKKDYGIDIHSFSKASLARVAGVTSVIINNMVDTLVQKYRPGKKAKRMPIWEEPTEPIPDKGR